MNIWHCKIMTYLDVQLLHYLPVIDRRPCEEQGKERVWSSRRKSLSQTLEIFDTLVCDPTLLPLTTLTYCGIAGRDCEVGWRIVSALVASERRE